MATAGLSRGPAVFWSTEPCTFLHPATVIGDEPVETLLPATTHFAMDIVLGNSRFQVVGVPDQRFSMFGLSLDMATLVPISRSVMLYCGPNRDMGIKVDAVNMQMLDRHHENGHRHSVRDPAGEAVRGKALCCRQQRSRRQRDRGKRRHIANGVAAIGLITLLAVGIGIMHFTQCPVTVCSWHAGMRNAVGCKSFAGFCMGR